MRATIGLLLLLSAPLLAQQAPPRFIYIYRESLKTGVDSAYGAIEDEAAQICADLECPNPYLGLESSTPRRRLLLHQPGRASRFQRHSMSSCYPVWQRTPPSDRSRPENCPVGWAR
jgi:hypothetical protein